MEKNHWNLYVVNITNGITKIGMQIEEITLKFTKT